MFFFVSSGLFAALFARLRLCSKAWWFWTLVGIAAAGGATGAVFALRSGDSPGGPNPTGVNVAVNANQAFGGSP